MMNWNVDFRRLQQYLIIVLFFSGFLAIISFGKISTLSLTMPFFIIVIYFLVSLLGIILGQITLSKKRICFLLFSCLICFFSYGLSSYRQNTNSLFLYIFYFAVFAFLDVRKPVFNSSKVVKIYVTIATVFSIFGIYQFFAYNVATFLPLKEIIPSFLWANDENTLTTIHGFQILGKEVYRAHSIYPEPSFFSQMCAIALLLMPVLKDLFTKRTRMLFYIFNIFGLIVSLSGTGVLILIVGLIYYWFRLPKRKKGFAIIMILITFILIVLSNDVSIIQYYFARIGEIFNNVGGSYSSGYYRFVQPFVIGFQNVFGYGIGNDDIALSLAGASESVVANGFGKIFIDIGIIGLADLIIMHVFMYPNKNIKDHGIAIIFFIICVCLDFCGSFLTPSFWTVVLFSACISQGQNVAIPTCVCHEKLAYKGANTI